MSLLPREERAQDEARLLGLTSRRALPFALLLLAGFGALAFDLTLPFRLPSDEDWARAAAAVQGRPASEAVQIWPPWAERARAFVTALPVLAEEDLAGADLVGVERLWLLSLPRVPFAGLSSAREALRRRGATAGEARRFGALSLEPWDLHPPPLVAELTLLGRALEEHEVDYVARRCVPVAIGGVLRIAGPSGAGLHVRAGVIGERAYDARRPPIEVRASVDGTLAGSLEVPRTVHGFSGWRHLDVALPPGPPRRSFAFEVSSPDRSRPFCLQAWISR